MPIRVRSRNWLGESPKTETERRLAATEASVSEAHIRINQLELMLMGHIAKMEGEPETAPEE
jgi:hypothetical protein